MLGLIVALILVGVLLWVVESLIPLDSTVKRLIQVVLVLVVVVYLIRMLGVL